MNGAGLRIDVRLGSIRRIAVVRSGVVWRKGIATRAKGQRGAAGETHFEGVQRTQRQLSVKLGFDGAPLDVPRLCSGTNARNVSAGPRSPRSSSPNVGAPDGITVDLMYAVVQQGSRTTISNEWPISGRTRRRRRGGTRAA